MKVATISGVVIAALAAGAIATPSFAQPRGYGYANDCRQDQRSNATAGTIIGGIAGAVLGSNLAAHHGGRSGGAALGAVAGALLGNSIGRSSSKCDTYAYDNGYRAPAYSSSYSARPAYGYDRYDARYRYDGYSRPSYGPNYGPSYGHDWRSPYR